ncbi:MAG: ATP-binding protein [Firmicutes bacterium]|nr:ATP-binding protein [Bacillota bacterium]
MTFIWHEQIDGRWSQRQKQVTTSGDMTVLRLAREHDIKIDATCGGRGRCGRCKIVVHGPLNQVSEIEAQLLTKEELARGIRLACYARPLGDIQVSIPTGETELLQILTEGSKQVVAAEPDVAKEFVTVDKPQLETPDGDRERLLETLKRSGQQDCHLPLGIMSSLPEILRRADHQVTVTRWRNHIVAVESGDTTDELFGLAFDIGTTTVVGGLIDLYQGKELAVAARLNGQAAYGADVISRVEYASNGASQLRRLQQAVVDTLNGVISELHEKTGISPEKMCRVVIVGNTCMQHLALGVSPTYIARSPYTPAFSRRFDVSAGQLGLAVNPEAPVTFLPNVAGFVGADTVGVVVATGLANQDGRVLMVDIGTNGEIVMSHGGRMVSCSTAAGPAFEGAQISSGMRAGEGAIEFVEIGEDIEIEVIGQTRPRGICGSGLIDLIAELLKVGIIDETGRLQDASELQGLSPKLLERIRTGEAGNEFVVVWSEDAADGSDIVLTQRDVRELQLAKGAIRAGTMILQKILGIKDEDIDELLLAGAFGNYIRKESAMRMGLLPRVPLEKVRSVGNAARVGARLCLISQGKLEEASRLAKSMDYVELSGRPDFQEAFMDAMLFPQDNLSSQDSTKINKNVPRDHAV